MSKHVYEAWHDAALFEGGIGEVVICRKKATGEITAGVFLVDVFCLGVKDAFLTKFPEARQASMIERIFRGQKPTSLSPACAKKLVEGAVAYAKSLGLPPNREYEQAGRLLNGIDAGACDTTFTFGKDGKPLYIQGPYDSPAFVKQVMTALSQHAGEGNYHYNMEVMDNFA